MVKLNADDLRNGEYVNADFSGTRFRNVNFAGAKFMEAMLLARFSGLITGLVINDIEVAPLIEAEMNRRDPERAKLNPPDAAGIRTAWSIVERGWTATRARAAALPEPVLHQRVDGEWSFLETQRHLIFVTDSWISGTMLGHADPHHPIGVPPSFVTHPDRLNIDTSVDPPLAEVLPVREQRMALVRDIVATITDAELDRQCERHTIRQCLHTLFDEEWQHNWYANRDLDTRPGPAQTNRALTKLNIVATTLRTTRLLLIPYTLEDEDNFVRLFSDQNVSRWIANTDGDLRALFRRGFAADTTIDWDIWAIWEGSRYIGHAELKPTPNKHFQGHELVYAILPASWGRGLGTEIADAITAHGLDTLKLSEVYATVDPANARSLSLLHNIGYQPVRDLVDDTSGDVTRLLGRRRDARSTI